MKNLIFLLSWTYQLFSGMISQPTQIKFKNSQTPGADFDIVRLESLRKLAALDHSPFQPHRVDFYLCILFLEGKSTHTIDFREYTCSPGTILTVRKDQLQKFENSTKAKGLMLLFTDEFIVSYLEKLQAQKTLQLFNEALASPKIQLRKKELDVVQSSFQRMSHEYFKVSDDYSQSIIRSELQILITTLFRLKSNRNTQVSAPKYLEEFLAFQKLVEEHVTDTSKVADYAKMMGKSTKTLTTITRALVNKSAKEFIDAIYLTQIKRLLINTDYSIKEIAYYSGFEEVPNFYKYFKKHTAFTPEGFRSGNR